MTITLIPSDNNYGQLSCNYISSVLGVNTLSEHVLIQGITNTDKWKRVKIDKKDAVTKFRQIRESVKEEHLQNAIDNIEIDESYKYLNDSTARQIQLRKLQEESILKIYIES